jgi:hypothetical protein
MNNKNTGIIATVATALICGCCGLFTCIMGIGTVTGNGNFTLGGNTQPMPPTVGYVFLCLSVIIIIIPIVVGFFMLRKKPEAESTNAPVPPTS